MNAAGGISRQRPRHTLVLLALGVAPGACTDPVELSPDPRPALLALYDATGGPGWRNNENWGTDAPVHTWYGVSRLYWTIDGFGLDLSENGLVGPIPRELGRLRNLRVLHLGGNELSGPIPAELGQLHSLWSLRLGGNRLSRPIPHQLGNLGSLRELYVWGNELSGPIPSQLGNLDSLTLLNLGDNRLSGPIPPELGNLTDLWELSLHGNELSGPIPPELGNLSRIELLVLSGNVLSGPLPEWLAELTSLRRLHLDHNNLTGSIPSGLGRISGLRELTLSHNEEMAGPLPSEFTSLRELYALVAGGTGLCAPASPGFQTWLEGIYKRRIANCGDEPSMAYLTQAVQSREFPVPLVAGDEALLRVFVTARRATSQGIPRVRARFYVDGRETHVAEIPGKSDPIPTEVDESSLRMSANAEIPGDVIRPGLEMVVEVDPEGTLEDNLLATKRIPETGRLALDVQAMPVFDLTLIPFVWTDTHDSAIVGLVEAMAADPETHEMLQDTRTLLPIGDLVVTSHEPVLSTTNNALTLLMQTSAIRTMEDVKGYYMGMMSPPTTRAAGVAYRPGWTSFSRPIVDVMAHEFGHNLSLRHAPCGGPRGIDYSFPYPDGSIGVWGYDFRNGGSLVQPSRPDVMAYCRPRWISDYYFTNALRFRLARTEPYLDQTTSLLLWGGVGADSVPFLEPAFVVEAPPALPGSAGEYRLTGRTGGGAVLFSQSFAMPEVADGDGSSSFAFAIPVRDGWEGSLAAITLSGPGGSVTLDARSDLPVAVLRDPRNGRVRGILRNPPESVMQQADPAAALGAGPGLEVLFSRGIPDAAAWRR